MFRGPSPYSICSNSAEDAQNPVEQSGDGSERARTVQQPGNGAEQVTEEVARSLLGGDVQLDLIEIHNQPEQVQVERAEDQVEDVTRAVRLHHLEALERLRRLLAVRIGDGRGAAGQQIPTWLAKSVTVTVAAERPSGRSATGTSVVTDPVFGAAEAESVVDTPNSIMAAMATTKASASLTGRWPPPWVVFPERVCRFIGTVPDVLGIEIPLLVVGP